MELFAESYQRFFDLPMGRVGAMADIHAEGDLIELRDLIIYPIGREHLAVGVRQMLVVRRLIELDIRKMGYIRLRSHGRSNQRSKSRPPCTSGGEVVMNSNPFDIPQELQDAVFTMAASGESVEAMAQRMADADLEKMAAIKLLRQATHSTLYEAKERIHCSNAYSYRRTNDEAFHEELFKALEEEGLIEPEAETVGSPRP